MWGPDDDDWDYQPKGISDQEFKDNVDYLENHPLFMKDVPKDFHQNEDITALQNLMYNEEPIKIARNLNEKGKEILSRGDSKYYWREALKSYEDALEQEFEDDDLKSRIFGNISLIEYKLRNYGHSIGCAKTAIKLNPKFIKPYYRAAQAYMMLDRFQDVVDISTQGLEIDPNCKEIQIIKKAAEEKLAAIKERELKKQSEVGNKFTKLVKDMTERGYVLGKRRVHEIPQAYEMDPFVEDGELKFMVIVTYLEFNQMDVIQKASETDLLSDHLKEIFKERLPWDEKGYYEYKNLAIYIDLNCVEPMYKSPHHTNYERGFLRVGRRQTLGDLLKANGYVMPFVLELSVLSRASPFFDKFQKDFDIIKEKK